MSTVIKYWSIDDRIIVPKGGFDAKILSNELARYEDENGEMKKMGMIKFETEVTCVGYMAFMGDSRLKAIELPDSITIIDDYAFKSCKNLNSIKFKNDVKKIGKEAFCNCKSLTEIELPESLEHIDDFAFKNSGVAYITIPESVHIIGLNPFLKCNNIAVIDSSFSQNIGTCLVKNNELLLQINSNNFNIPNDVYTLKSYSINNNNCISSLNLSENSRVEYIENDAVANCSRLEVIDLPINIKYIGNNAFGNCPNLYKVTLKSKIPPVITYNSFIGHADEFEIWVPKGSKEVYLNATDWIIYKDYIREIV